MQPTERSPLVRVILAAFGAAFGAVVLTFGFFLATSRQVHGDSMRPVLTRGDRVVISSGATPGRLDVVALVPPGADSLAIKRIVGLPGDRVRIRPGEAGYTVEIEPAGLREWFAVRYAALGGGSVSACCPSATGTSALSSFATPVLIPDGKFFVLGDNPAVSEDSRTYGLVSASDVRGRARFKIWPLGHITSGITIGPAA